MKNLVLTLLVFAMLTPGFACAQFVDSQKSHTSMSDTAKGMPCCPKSDQKSDTGTKMFKGCTKIDLLHVSNIPLLKKIDVFKIAPYILPQEVIAGNFGLSQIHFIRGPPDPPEIFRSFPPIFLATQRLRI